MLGDFGKIVKLVGEMKRKMPEMQGKLARNEYTGEAGGVVTATVNGRMELVDIKIDPQVLTNGDAEMLADLIKAAVSSAQQEATTAAQQALAELTGGMNIPGLDAMIP